MDALLEWFYYFAIGPGLLLLIGLFAVSVWQYYPKRHLAMVTFTTNDKEPFTDQNRRYYDLQAERAQNGWRIAYCLVLLLLVAAFLLALQGGVVRKTYALRCSITVLTEAIVLGWCYLISDQSRREHENSKANLCLEKAENEGRPDFTAWVCHKYGRRLLLGYYVVSFLGLGLFAGSFWQ